ncbi:hypothetical protein GCM10011613_32500 [Cellvibrio zantedeschiae]|uniref:Uncharacterized protein n=1 Tax=Cellvibrio zantedeschiae TaxID=1237077 RepID=A0ABQ3BD06_9GAMM|nr:hypothetical protein [Cellvibrio zantedeschiae]GGY84926.1 hypothetical protein GCM10011613_32500 [Cellvibrio zantedeschiae]
MFNPTQKKLALSFSLLSNKDQAHVLKALPQEKIEVLEKLLEELAQRGIKSSSLKYLKDSLNLVTSDFIHGTNVLNNQSKEFAFVSDYAMKNNHEIPKKLFEYIRTIKN